MHEAVPGKRFDRYHELGQHAFDDKLDLWLIVPQQVMVQAGCDIVYMVTRGSSLMKFYSIVCPDCKPIKLSYFITSVSFADVVMSLSGLGTVTFSFSGHNIASIPSTLDKPSKIPLWKGSLLAYIIIALCYFPVAFVGYYAFGENVDDNVLLSLEKPIWLIATANIFVVIHVIGSYQ
ncbi:Lysine histidine transporter 1, partial [Bienertia sinuspersici]